MKKIIGMILPALPFIFVGIMLILQGLDIVLFNFYNFAFAVLLILFAIFLIIKREIQHKKGTSILISSCIIFGTILLINSILGTTWGNLWPLILLISAISIIGAYFKNRTKIIFLRLGIYNIVVVFLFLLGSVFARWDIVLAIGLILIGAIIIAEALSDKENGYIIQNISLAERKTKIEQEMNKNEESNSTDRLL